MTARIADGKAVALEIRAEVARTIREREATGRTRPTLHVVLCGDNPASHTYVRGKGRAAAEVGIGFTLHEPAAASTTAELLDLVRRLNADRTVDAILVQLPLPPQVDQDAVIEAVDPAKDVDGFHPLNAGRLAVGRALVAPCTPVGCMELLRREGVDLRGRRAVVVGRSVIVGRPMAALLLNADATVTICHSRTADLAAVCREAEVLIAAVGRPGMIDGGHVRPGAWVIDVGTTRVDGKVRGDVDRASVEPIAQWLTPVPGGVGPMTIAMLMRNTLTLAVAGHDFVAAAVSH